MHFAYSRNHSSIRQFVRDKCKVIEHYPKTEVVKNNMEIRNYRGKTPREMLHL